MSSWSVAFDLHVREVNLTGDVLDEVIIPATGSFVSVWWQWTGGCPSSSTSTATACKPWAWSKA
ncbi:hypothetical protein [Ideonella paludis]|uniref:hypothetical protein n=1 Tax=Ideonella paludis TaxID=1233411 RepID=UPI003624B75C